MGEPEQKFDIILADPPWHYNSRRASASKFGGGACFHYDLMQDEEICALPVSEIAADNSVLFLWATWPRLPLALKVIEDWGFEYKTCAFDWFKLNTNGGLFFGVGYYAKSNSEPCLLATRGDVLRPASNAVSMAIAGADGLTDEVLSGEAFMEVRRQHSRKPDAVHRRIEEMYPDSRRIELFARRPRPGWTVWGNELTNGQLPLTEILSSQRGLPSVKRDSEQFSIFECFQAETCEPSGQRESRLSVANVTMPEDGDVECNSQFLTVL